MTTPIGSLFDFVPVLLCHGPSDYVYFKAFNFMSVASFVRRLLLKEVYSCNYDIKMY